jgi:hypothetical protein
LSDINKAEPNPVSGTRKNRGNTGNGKSKAFSDMGKQSKRAARRKKNRKVASAKMKTAEFRSANSSAKPNPAFGARKLVGECRQRQEHNKFRFGKANCKREFAKS